MIIGFSRSLTNFGTCFFWFCDAAFLLRPSTRSIKEAAVVVGVAPYRR